MRRRAFLGSLACALLAAPLAAEGQQTGKIPRIGYLTLYPVTPTSSPALAGFLGGLRDLGYVESRNIVIDYRNAGGRAEQRFERVQELVNLNVDVIVAYGGIDAEAAAKLTRTVPIVMVYVSDPIAMGLIKSLARPGGNVTGLALLAPEVNTKRFEMLREIRPGITRVGLLWDLAIGPLAQMESLRPGYEAAARAIGITLHPLPVRVVKDFDSAFETARRERFGAVLLGPDTALQRANRNRIAELGVRHRMLMIAEMDHYAEAGALLSYGPDVRDLARRAATYVDKILKGAKAADLPVEQPTKFELVINLKTAKALGLTIPPSLLSRADEVIR